MSMRLFYYRKKYLKKYCKKYCELRKQDYLCPIIHEKIKVMAIKILTTDSDVYSGKKDGSWTEPKTGKYRLDEPMTFIHKSHNRIDEFQTGVTTCVYDEYMSEKFESSPLKSDVHADILVDYTSINGNLPEYVYAMELPEGTRIDEYGNEYRFEMNHNVKISLIGRMGNIRVKDDSYESRVYGGHTISVFTKKY